jgi:hypothetical protein
MAPRPMDAIITRRCPICGQKMKINEPRDFARALREHEQSAHPAYYTQTMRLRKMIAPMLVSIVVLPFVPIIFEPALGSLLAATLSIAGFISPLAIVGLIGTRALRQAKQRASASMDQTVSPNTFFGPGRPTDQLLFRPRYCQNRRGLR